MSKEKTERVSWFTLADYFQNYVDKELVINEDEVALLQGVSVRPNKLVLKFRCRDSNAILYIEGTEKVLKLHLAHKDKFEETCFTPPLQLAQSIKEILYTFIKSIDNDGIKYTVKLDFDWK